MDNLTQQFQHGFLEPIVVAGLQVPPSKQNFKGHMPCLDCGIIIFIQFWFAQLISTYFHTK